MTSGASPSPKTRRSQSTGRKGLRGVSYLMNFSSQIVNHQHSLKSGEEPIDTAILGELRRGAWRSVTGAGTGCGTVQAVVDRLPRRGVGGVDRKSTRLNSSH